LAGRGLAAAVTRLPPHVFAVGLGAIADAPPASRRAGELLAACGTLFHRPEQPHAAVDYVVPTGALVAEANLLTALVWEGVPSGHAGYDRRRWRVPEAILRQAKVVIGPDGRRDQPDAVLEGPFDEPHDPALKTGR
jgi:hypothetical protein